MIDKRLSSIKVRGLRVKSGRESGANIGAQEETKMHMLKLFRTLCSFFQRAMVGFQVIRAFHYFKQQGKSLDVNLKRCP